MVLGDTVRGDGEGLSVTMRHSHCNCVRKQKDSNAALSLPFPFVPSLWPELTHRVAWPSFRMDLFSSVKLFWENCHRVMPLEQSKSSQVDNGDWPSTGPLYLNLKSLGANRVKQSIVLKKKKSRGNFQNNLSFWNLLPRLHSEDIKHQTQTEMKHGCFCEASASEIKMDGYRESGAGRW